MSDPRWRFDATCPADWPVHLERCGGGFFHSPAGLDTCAGAGERLYGRLVADDHVVGVAGGVRRCCRLRGAAGHVYFPTLPATFPGVGTDAALERLSEALRDQGGVAEAVFDSFDARWSGVPAGAAPRVEHVVDLRVPLETRLRRLDREHRRRVRRGEQEAWTLTTVAGEPALRLLRDVHHAAAARAALRGDPFQAEPMAGAWHGDLTAPWGTATWCASRDGQPLAAALIGWANRRAFYVMGGSTPDGYAHGGATWLHWRIMGSLAEAGFRAYNLGGTPAGAVRPEHPSHGLHRFKRGFGADVLPRSGARWRFRPGHLLVHGVVAWARRVAALRVA